MSGGSLPKKLTRAIRNREIVNMRLSGASYDDIADKFGLNRSSCASIVRAYLDRVNSKTEESAEALRELESQRLDRMLLGIWERAQDGDINAIQTCLKIQDRRAKLFGIDLEKGAMSNPDDGGAVSQIVVEKFKRTDPPVKSDYKDPIDEMDPNDALPIDDLDRD